MGCCWESLIKTIKRRSYVILKNSIIFVETLTTVLCEVGCIVNNCPLLPISDDINDYDLLTLNNFLLVYRSRDVNIGNGMQTNQINYRQKWKEVQNIENMYWNRWFKEYIPTLTPSSKWMWQIRNFKIGDLVVVKSKYILPNHWNSECFSKNRTRINIDH